MSTFISYITKMPLKYLTMLRDQFKAGDSFLKQQALATCNNIELFEEFLDKIWKAKINQHLDSLKGEDNGDSSEPYPRP